MALGTHIANHGAYALSNKVLGLFDYVNEDDSADEGVTPRDDEDADQDGQSQNTGLRLGDIFGDYRLHVTLHLINPDGMCRVWV